MKPGEPGYRGPETEDEFLAEVEALPAPLVLESVEYGWSLEGYWYVRIKTGADGPHGTRIVCASRTQAREIAETIRPRLRLGGNFSFSSGSKHAYPFDDHLDARGIPKTRKLKLPPSVRGGIIPKGIYAARKHADVRIARRASTITEQRYRFWVQGPLPGQNEIVKAAKGFGGRGYGYSRLKKAWTQSIAWLVKAARIPPLKRVRLEFEWVHANRRRDKDNVEGGGAKLAWDSLVVAGVLKNDGWKQNAGSTHTHTLGPKPGVWITVIPVAASNSRLGSSSTPPR